MSNDRDWYNKLPIAEINKLIAGTGWDVKKIYSALSIQKLNLQLEKGEIWDKMRNYHWDEPEYKELLPIYRKLENKIENIGIVQVEDE